MLRRSLLSGVGATALCAMAPRRVALLGSNGPSLDLNFLAATSLDSRITFTRASTATSGLYTDAAGSSYTTYGSGVPRLIATTGLLIEEARTNSLLNSDTPATQTTASLGTGTYTLWVIGTGSATSSAGTATGSSFGAATAGAPNTFTLTGAGTVVITVSGSLTRFQLEAGAFPTSYIPTTGATASRVADVASMAGVSPWFSAGAGTLSVEAMVGATLAAGQFGETAGLDNGTQNNVFNVLYNPFGNVRAFVTAAGVNTFAPAQQVPALFTTFKVALSYSSSGFLTSYNASAPGSITPGALPTGINHLRLGNSLGSTKGVIWLRRFRYWPRTMGQNELQATTL